MADRNRTATTVVAVAIGALLVAGGVFLATRSTPVHHPVTTKAIAPVPVATGSAAPAAPATTAPQPATTAPQPASADPMAGQVKAMFDSYFGAINSQNLRLAYDAHSPAFQAQQSYQAFVKGATSSSDANVAVGTISHNTDGSITAVVTFTSHQTPENGPARGETCTNWSLAYRLLPAPAGGPFAYLIDSTSPVGAGHTPC